MARRRDALRSPGLAAALTVVAGTIGVALLALTLRSLDQAAGGASLGLGSPYLWRVIGFTLLQAGLSTALAVALGVPVALALARRPAFPGRSALLALFAVPLALPALVAVLGIVVVFGANGWLGRLAAALGLGPPPSIYGLSGILIAHVFFNLPLVARLALAELERIPGESWRLAAELGLTRLGILRFIEGPVLVAVLPGIAGLVAMLCVASFTVVLTLGGGPRATTVEVAVYQALRFDFAPALAVRLALAQIAICAVLVALLGRLATPEAVGWGPGRRIMRLDGRGRAGLIGDHLVIWLAAAFVLLPLLSVVTAGLGAPIGRLVADPEFLRALATSLLVAVSAGLLSLAIAWPILEVRARLGARRDGRQAARRLLEQVLSLSIVVPPVVVGAGWFVLLLPLGNPARFAPAIVVALNAIMALPFVARVLGPALEAHLNRHDRLAASLGIEGLDRLRLVDWPVLRRPVLLALVMAGLVSLGDLGAIALFGSDRLTTLPFLLYQRMGSYRTNDAAGIALLLLAAALAITLLSGQLGRERRR